MAEYICSKCGAKIGLGKEKILLVSKVGEELVFCSKCYNELPKEEKHDPRSPTLRVSGKLMMTNFQRIALVLPPFGKLMRRFLVFSHRGSKPNPKCHG